MYSGWRRSSPVRCAMPIARVNDPEGYEVALEDERWEHIIIEGHPEIAPLQAILIQCISEHPMHF
jgi:hypothetical protein